MKKLAMSPIYKIGRNKNKNKIKLRIGVFFDGTRNNKYNSDSGYYSSDYYKRYKCIDEGDEKIYDDIKTENSSYWNSYSNIALLHQLYEEKNEEKNDFKEIQIKVYIEGIGSKKDKKDDMLGSGLGEGSRGVIARVNEACFDISSKIDKKLGKDKKNIEIESIQFDVFGFSRGAAAARHFCNEILKTKREPLNDKFQKLDIKNIKTVNVSEEKNTQNLRAEISELNVKATRKVKDNLQIPKKNFFFPTREIFTGGLLGEFLKKRNIFFPKKDVSIEFLGLFDTVISQMLEREGVIDFYRNKNICIPIITFTPILLKPATLVIPLIKKVNPNLNNPNIKKILQIRAQDEWRYNFPITPIGETNSATFSKDIYVLGAHSDIGGGYWKTLNEFNNQLHFFDIEVNADEEKKQRVEEFKESLKNWYISKNLCNSEQIWWKTLHHVRKIDIHGRFKNVLLEKEFMGNQTRKTRGRFTYQLIGYHYKLQSKRQLSNKLSLVYMNVMKDMAKEYANVPFGLPKKKTKHIEEYKYSTDEEITKKMKKYEDFIKKVTEHEWTNKEGKTITYPNIIYTKNKEPYYTIPSEHYGFIKKNFVHLSANLNKPLIQILDHMDNHIVYTDIPNFSDEDTFKDPPYERAVYTPSMDNYDIR